MIWDFLKDSRARAAGRGDVLKVSQWRSFAASKTWTDALVVPQVHQLDAFNLHEVYLNDVQLILLHWNFSEVCVVAKQPVFQLLDLVVVGREIQQVWEVYEYVFRQLFNSVATKVNDFQTVDVLKDAKRNFLDLIFGQVQVSKFFHIFKVSKLDESQSAFRYHHRFQVRKDKAKFLWNVFGRLVQCVECQNVFVIATWFVKTRDVFNVRVTWSHRQTFDITTITGIKRFKVNG